MTKYGMTSSQVSSVTAPESEGSSEIPNLGGSDSSPILITGHKLNGHNYLQWSQSVLLFICGKGNDEYLTGEAAMLETTEPGFRKWKIESSMIMSWLINSMNNDIGENFLLFGTAKDIWDAAKETYSSSENTSELFSATYRQIVEQKRLFKFFLGLNRELDDVRGRIMGIKPLPSLKEAFSEVRREESRKKVMMGSKEQPAPTLDASALAARSFNSSGGDRQKRDRPWCDYCKKLGHYKEACWKLHGKPVNWKPSHSLTEMAEHTTTGIAFTANRGGMKPWIVDTGASDHMTGDAAILQNYKPSSTSSHVANSQTKSLKQVAYSLRLPAGTTIGIELGLKISGRVKDHKAHKMKTKGIFTEASAGTTIGIELGLKISGRVKDHKAHKMKTKGIFTEASAGTTIGIRAWVEDFWKSKRSQSTQDETKGIFTEGGVDCYFVRLYEVDRDVRKNGSTWWSERARNKEEEKTGIRARITANMWQYIDSISSLPEENIGEDRAGEVLIPSIDDSTSADCIEEGVPNTIQEAFKISEWKKAVQDEIDALEKNGTWTITDLPVGKSPWGASGFSP
ncbi:hypothetical protein CK203_007745 [Vitis vinifera]|uniref:Retrotransposon Copia-like N-terminal domain-containing protein n=1 Tax=Vitis vinifera TaxID=29760 RepID=A0A438K1H2_VITVI|nr:hypothetical protein CK203_007745 [Vitis vinifera]